MKQKNAISVVIIAIVVIVIGFSFWMNRAAQAPAANTNAAVANVPVHDAASYTQAVNQYTGFRIQFTNCSGNPSSLTVKAGQKFMLDNRDTRSHDFGIANLIFQTAAHDYSIVSGTKVGSYNITCDGGGTTRLTVEK